MAKKSDQPIKSFPLRWPADLCDTIKLIADSKERSVNKQIVFILRQFAVERERQEREKYDA
ncbi:MAG: Arc family DNA-binding protein [Planctomycetota bacterium]